MNGYEEIPSGMVVVGTCGSCGGPVLSPQCWGSKGTADDPPAHCDRCGRAAKPEPKPTYGPIREMQ